MLQMNKGPLIFFGERFKAFLGGLGAFGGSKAVFLFLFLSLPIPASAYQILFYYNSQGINGAVKRCTTVLQKADHRITAIDVKGKQRNPGSDNWGAYDQVWDMRFVERDKEKCGSGSPSSADYFDSHWIDQSVSYLNHCGKLFLAAEHYQLADRDEGLYQFLKEIHAVKEGYDTCAPSTRGNSTTNAEEFYAVKNGLGPATFFGAYVGGIPLAYLTGTNFVDTREDWQNEDGVDRSIVSGWKGNQLSGRINTPLSCRGKLFMVWDATMWTLWQPEVQDEAEETAPWDESSWFPPNPDANEDRERAREIRRGQAVTRKFFPAVAKWLGNESCNCEQAVRAQAPPAPTTPVMTQHKEVNKVAQPTVIPTIARAVTTTPKSQISVSSPSGLNSPETIVFTAIPINLLIHFRDGAGDYRLDVWNLKGQHLRTLYKAQITTQKEAWASWDGLDEQGGRMPPGLYHAVLSKEGRILRKIVLSWVVVPVKP